MAHNPVRRRRSTRPPARHLERELLSSGHQLVAGMDEVGRGALAGPVSVGVAVVDAGTGRTPAGLRDSKLLTSQARERLCAPIRRWSRASAVGHAQPEEIDRWGLIAAMRLAGQRALTLVAAAGLHPTMVILDGQHDWLSPPGAPPEHPPRPPALAGAVEDVSAADADDGSTAPALTPQVVTKVKGDLSCTVVAAASVLAKCERDQLMVAMHEDHPQYAFADNKGYSAPEHLRALTTYGPAQVHRRSWALPGLDGRLDQWDLQVLRDDGRRSPAVEEGMMDL